MCRGVLLKPTNVPLCSWPAAAASFPPPPPPSSSSTLTVRRGNFSWGRAFVFEGDDDDGVLEHIGGGSGDDDDEDGRLCVGGAEFLVAGKLPREVYMCIDIYRRKESK